MKFTAITVVAALLLCFQAVQCKVSSPPQSSFSSSPSSSSTKNATTVSYPGIGTFNATDYLDQSSTKKSTLYLPFSPSTINLIFQLYTRSNRQQPQNITWNSTESLQRAANFDGSKPTKIIVHGYSENPSNREWMHDMKNAFLERMDVNVIIADWSGGNKEPYGQAVANAPLVGPMIAIQMSLMITGLDPAGPSFKDRQPKGRLWYSDAKFVDVIHTDAKPLVGMGYEEPSGTVDLYPNGAKSQPGCAKDRIGACTTSRLYVMETIQKQLPIDVPIMRLSMQTTVLVVVVEPI
ncbi:PREDICTED: pancreatic lipase-related protein 2-like, partial [Rhagoletis zephyria]|uniref:pancreatic lipase-related protein 2-like n=1 Tax=Rhagoletis zephyria TaxID=28612 RepID=UPI0008113778